MKALLSTMKKNKLKILLFASDKRCFNYLINISGQKPEIIKVKLPPGDPEKSAGNYNKLSELLNIDIKKFVEIDEGLTETFYDYKKIQGIK